MQQWEGTMYNHNTHELHKWKVQWKKADMKEYLLYDFIGRKYKNGPELIYAVRSQD